MGFDTHRKADIVVVTEGPTDAVSKPSDVTALNPTHLRSDAERIAAIRARAKAVSKAINLPGAKYGAEYPAWRFEDCEAGPQTSVHDFNWLVYLLGFLRDGDPRFHIDNASAKYNRHTGICAGEHPFSIQDLRDAVVRRCAELGISQVRLEQYLSTGKPWEESRAFHELSFEQKMQMFRA